MTERFPRAARLRSRDQFTAVQRSGRRVNARFVTLVALANAVGRDRLGIVASRRVGGAVARTRAKRRIRELFRRQPAGTAPSGGSLDVVAIARAELPSARFADVQADFHHAIARLRGLNSRRP
jgi:ribonuclease P protein component